jgi:hypothetical protein
MFAHHSTSLPTKKKNSLGPAFRPSLETLEDRTLLASSIDISMLSATTKDSHSITFQYRLTSNASPFRFSVYRSADASWDGSDVPVGHVGITSVVKDVQGQAATKKGTHTLRARGIDLPQDPEVPYVLVVADTQQQISEMDEANNTAHFRKHLLGVVTHGFSLAPGVPPWATAIADSLDDAGYDAAFAFDWSWLSKLPAPGKAKQAAQQLAGQIEGLATNLDRKATDVVDLHVIGHSRGTVVNSLALDLIDHPLLTAGWMRHTMLDPHPARNLLPKATAVADVLLGQDGISQGGFFSYATTPFGIGAALTTLAGQAAMNDPWPYFGRQVDQGENFYQQTPSVLGPFDPLNMDTYVNFWGFGPSMIAKPANLNVQSLQLDGLFHYEIPQWYLANLETVLGH